MIDPFEYLDPKASDAKNTIFQDRTYTFNVLNTLYPNSIDNMIK